MGRSIKMPDETQFFYPVNTNPSGKRTGDCVIRALASALDMSWDDVLDDLVFISHNLHYSPTSLENYDRVLIKHGYVKLKMPRKFDNTRYRGFEFCEYLNNKYGNMIDPPKIVCNIGSHHVTCFKEINGTYKINDIWDCSDECVGSYWAKY